jgi:cytoskeletal protein RodZ
MDDDSKHSVWISALQIVLGIVVIVGAVGFALWYANQRPAYSPALEQAVEEVRQKSSSTRSSRDDSWGIVHDSPLRRR